MTRSAVFDWLSLADVAARFALDEAGVEALADWAERAGFRFGLDEAQRESLGLPRAPGSHPRRESRPPDPRPRPR